MSLYYVELGQVDRPAIVLLHGLGMGHRMWMPQFDHLSERYHVLAPDLPGFARSAALGPFMLIRAATAIAELIHARCHNTVHVCGLSLGAMVALQLSLMGLDRPTSLILSAGQVRPPAVLMAAQHLLLACIPEQRLLKSMAADLPSQDVRILAAAREDMLLTGKRACLQAMREAGKANFQPVLGHIRQPTLILCGNKDRANLPAARQLARGVPKAELHIIPDTGHVWNMEKPILFNETISAFIDRIETM